MPSKCKLVKTDFTTPYTRNNYPFVEKETVPSVRSVRFHSTFQRYRWISCYFSIINSDTETSSSLCVSFVLSPSSRTRGHVPVVNQLPSLRQGTTILKVRSVPWTVIEIKEEFRYRPISIIRWMFYLCTRGSFIYIQRKVLGYLSRKLLKFPLVIKYRRELSTV